MAKKKKKSKNVAIASKAQVKAVKQVFERIIFEPGFWRKNMVGAAIVFVLGFGLYLRTLNYEYVLDDQIVITKNAYTEKGFAGIWDIMTTESFQGYFQSQKNLVVGSRYRPLSIVTFAIERGIMGENNRQLSHFINALIYGLSGLLLFRVLSLLFGTKGRPEWFLALGFGASLLWVVHPLHTEAVANIKGRDEIMALIGSLAALYYALKYVEKGTLVSLVMACISFFLGLLSKETTITFLGIIPLSIYFFQSGSIRRILKIFLPLLGVFVLYIILRVQVIGFLLGDTVVTDIMNNPFAEMNAMQKYATIFYTLILYLKLSIVPHPLTHDYYPFHIPTMEWTDVLPIMSMIIYLAMGVYALWGIRKRTIPSYAILFYIMALSIVSNLFFPIGTFMNERFVFMASIGMCILIAWFLLEFLPTLTTKIKPLYGGILLGILVLSYSYKTFTRIPAWRSPLSLNASAIMVSKNSARANVFTGTAYFNEYKDMAEGEVKRNTLARASQYIKRSKELFPAYHNANLMLAGIIAEEYKYDRDLDKLLGGFTEIVKTSPRIPFMQEYYDYLNGRVDSQALLDYFYNTGKTILIDQQFKYNDGLNQLQYGLNVDANNERILRAMAETYETIGNSSKAQEYYNRIR